MHSECLPANLREILKNLGKVVHTHRLILAGGTGLALQIGHRISVDLDFFTPKPFSAERIFQQIKRLGLKPKVEEESKGSLTVTIEGTKVSFFHYPYPFIEGIKGACGIPVAGITDIASMKAIAISQRGAKRDFIDLYFVLQATPFRKVAENMIKRFGKDRVNPVHIGKSLVCFNDAESDPEPRFCGKVKPAWETVKKFFIKNIRQMVMDLEKAVE